MHLIMVVDVAAARMTEPHKDDEKTAQSLGVIAHVVILAAKYLQVQLRYPPVLCGSRSRIVDPAPVVEVTAPLYRVKTDPRGLFKGAAWLHADVCLVCITVHSWMGDACTASVAPTLHLLVCVVACNYAVMSWPVAVL